MTLFSCEKKPLNKNIYIIFRYDDTCVYSNSQIETQLLTLFNKHHFPLTFAVIPYRCEGEPINPSPQKVLPLTTKKSQILQPFIDNGTLEIALHGYSHQTVSTKVWTEFENVSYTTQKKHLIEGKKLLESLFHNTITSFVPPYNTYDTNTISILESLGITTISANLNAPTFQKSKIHFLSHTITLDQIERTIQKEQTKETPSFIVVMFHEYNFSNISVKGVKKPEITFKEMNTLLTYLKRQKHIHITTLQKAAQLLERKTTL